MAAAVAPVMPAAGSRLAPTASAMAASHAHSTRCPELRQQGTPGSSVPRTLGTTKLAPSHARASIGATQPIWLTHATGAGTTSTAPAAMVILCQVTRATIPMERLRATTTIMPLTFLCLSGTSWLARKKGPANSKNQKVVASKDEGPEDTFLANHDPLDMDSE